MPLDRKVVGSNLALAATPGSQGPWASPSLTVACSDSACKLRHSVNCCGWKRLWVPRNLKRRYRNIRNEWMNIVFPLSVVDGIMGGLFLCMNSCMYARMYVHLCICILVCMHVCVYVWRMTFSMSKRKQNSWFVVRKYLCFTGKLDLAKWVIFSFLCFLCGR